MAICSEWIININMLLGSNIVNLFIWYFDCCLIRLPQESLQQSPESLVTSSQLVACSLTLLKSLVCQTPSGETECSREKTNEKRERRHIDGHIDDYFRAISGLKPELSIICHYILYVLSRQGVALINEESEALVRTLNYFCSVVFQKQWSNREENTESNAS